jgi:hypothetical protein
MIIAITTLIILLVLLAWVLLAENKEPSESLGDDYVQESDYEYDDNLE